MNSIVAIVGSDQFKERRLKPVVVLENIDDVRELKVEDGHATYREIKAIFVITTFIPERDLFASDSA